MPIKAGRLKKLFGEPSRADTLQTMSTMSENYNIKK
jgi:hypothetical protein